MAPTVGPLSVATAVCVAVAGGWVSLWRNTSSRPEAAEPQRRVSGIGSLPEVEPLPEVPLEESPTFLPDDATCLLAAAISAVVVVACIWYGMRKGGQQQIQPQSLQTPDDHDAGHVAAAQATVSDAAAAVQEAAKVAEQEPQEPELRHTAEAVAKTGDSMLQPTVGSPVKDKRTGRQGDVIVHDVGDELTYKVSFKDGASPTEDWFNQDSVELLPQCETQAEVEPKLETSIPKTACSALQQSPSPCRSLRPAIAE